MTADFSTEAAALGTEARHWRRACAALGDLEVGASATAWKELESYLGESVRKSLTAQAKRLTAQADRVLFALDAAQTPADLVAARSELLTLRRRYTRAEAMVDFYCEAVNTRTSPRIAAVLRGLDTLAVYSMDVVLRPLGIESPPVLTYLDKGMGASILRAGARLWDASLSPAAAIKITRHNLWQPTSLVHETGHQVAHLTSWATELAAALQETLASHSPIAADAWHSWASEVAADVYAFSLLGYAPVPALATVVDGPARAVFRMPIGDPHPVSMLRVQFNVALCRSWFGPGPWDALGARWLARYPVAQAPSDVAQVIRESMPLLPALVDICTRAPMNAFHGASLSTLADPRRVAPTELNRLAERAGASLYTSSYLQRQEPMRILALTVLRGLDSKTAPIEMETWLRRVGGDRSIAA
ncbi:hypothetical protein Mycsm_03798 [Mycobacterium sp. JS623]|uniref:hypothetical protein n=1 Tax=Mycobacterium sp. JS623 TaxID=212767 RepID=UPI0002A58552|nr:hypothetical protein [Mycobacterium sp. JS623]AGB24069.1 hypothetical protein Mycsm_03798 [Mycobacterium sp. JS623]